MWSNKEWESLKLYISSIRRLKKDSQKENRGNQYSEEIYDYLDKEVIKLSVFKDEAQWKQFLTQSDLKKESPINQERETFVIKLKHEIGYLKHFLKDKHHVNSIVDSIASDKALTEVETQTLKVMEWNRFD